MRVPTSSLEAPANGTQNRRKMERIRIHFPMGTMERKEEEGEESFVTTPY